MIPTIQLHTLPTTDGSATYRAPNHTILCGVNYPLEVQYRSKERPEDTYIEVNFRPHNAVAGVRERHVESIVKKVLTSIVLGSETPRCMLQVTLQVTDVGEDESLPGGVKSGGQGEGYLGVLGGLINAAVAGCLDGGVQMGGVAGAVMLAVMASGEVVVWPDVRQMKRAGSVHVFGYGGGGECLVMESEGEFDMEEWMGVEGLARKVVLGGRGVQESDVDDVEMDENGDNEGTGDSVFSIMRRAVETRVQKDGRWKVS